MTSTVRVNIYDYKAVAFDFLNMRFRDVSITHVNSYSASHDQLMHWDTFKQDNCSTVGGDGGCRVGEVRAGTTSPMPEHKGFMLQ